MPNRLVTFEDTEPSSTAYRYRQSVANALEEDYFAELMVKKLQI